jgi:anti-sigma regulatory factor (Ser/Thr protein kinase)
MNEHLYKYCENTPDYMTAVYTLMDYESGEIVFSLAGHPRPWLIGPGGEAKQVGAVGSLLGQFQLDSNGASRFEDVHLALEPAQSLLLYSDGLMEQEDKNGIAFQENFRRDVVPKLFGKDPDSSYTILKREFENHLAGKIPDDDVSFIFISKRPTDQYDTFEFVPGQALMDMTNERRKSIHGLTLQYQPIDAGRGAEERTEGYKVINDIAEGYLPVIKKLEEAAWPLQVQKRVEIVLREMIVNAVMHGNLCSDKHRVKLRFILYNGVLEVSVSDEGKGFDGTTLKQSIGMKDILRESGRGLFIVGLYADHMYFNEAGNKCWALFSRDEMAASV